MEASHGKRREIHTSRSGCCATPPVSEDSIIHLSTGSPFGHHPRLRMVCPRRGQWIETVASIITPTSKNSNFVVTLSRRSKHIDRQVLVGVTTKFYCHTVVTLLSRTQSIHFQLVNVSSTNYKCL